MNLPVDPLQVVLGWVLLGWFVIAAGLLAVYLDERSEIFERVWHVAMYLTLPFTGAFTMVDWLPEAAQTILLYSPMVNAVEMLREGYFGVGINAKYSISYLVTCNIVLTGVALLLLQRVKKIITAD
jgi:ABC-type polysaccharide/polyol phosphate export permease